MNERIRELAEKAGLSYEQDDDSYCPEALDVEKFAKLIIGECINTLNEAVYIALRPDGEQEHIDVVLLEHFDLDDWTE